MKNSTVRAGPKSNRKIVDKDEIDTPNTQIHDGSLHWLGTCTSIKSGGVNLVLWTLTLLVNKCGHASFSTC